MYTYYFLSIQTPETTNTNNEKSVLRLNLGNNFDQQICSIIQDVKHTTYKIGAKIHQAPDVTECITMMRYIICRLTNQNFPLTLIGSMAQHLLQENFLNASLQSLSEYQKGDLVFFYGKSRFQIEMIHHVGMIINMNGDYIHSANKGIGFKTTNIDKTYESIATHQQLLTSQDPRWKE